MRHAIFSHLERNHAKALELKCIIGALGHLALSPGDHRVLLPLLSDTALRLTDEITDALVDVAALDAIASENSSHLGAIHFGKKSDV
jgi:hypothetical protein